MIYIDTDLIINTYVKQNAIKHKDSIELLEKINNDSIGKISVLSIQETLFVLAKLKVNKAKITSIFNQLMSLNPLVYDINILERASSLANVIGFQHINDCIHTAIAETCCSEIITYNKKDFSKIAKLTSLKVTIL